MDTWLKVRAFFALYVLVLGIGLMFGRWDGSEAIGALLVSIGLTVLLPFVLALALALRQK
jgi:hypothetical protein